MFIWLIKILEYSFNTDKSITEAGGDDFCGKKKSYNLPSDQCYFFIFKAKYLLDRPACSLHLKKTSK